MPVQFTLAGSVVMCLGMVGTGTWVSSHFEEGVLRSAGAASTLQIQDLLSPVIRDVVTYEALSPPAQRALSEILENSPIDDRIVSYQIALDLDTFQPLYGDIPGDFEDRPEDRLRAWNGEFFARIVRPKEGSLPPALLEVYSPVLQPLTADVVAISRHFESAEGVQAAITNVKLRAWSVIGAVFLAIGTLLVIIVISGGRAMAKQNTARKRQLKGARRLLSTNEELRKRLIELSDRDLAEHDRMLRRLGYELHDGPAQYIALAKLRLSSAIRGGAGSKDSDAVERALSKALEELRLISRGMAVPDLEETPISDLVQRVCKDISLQTDLLVDIYCPDQIAYDPNYSRKLCCYRFLQETLTNVSKHANVGICTVTVEETSSALTLSVSDEGDGFTGIEARQLRNDGGQGLFGLVERAESIGATLKVETAPGEGSTFQLIIPTQS